MLNTINITRIPNMKNFLEIVDRCKNPVYIDLNDTEICDLKSNETARGILTSYNDHYYGNLKLKVSEEDSMRFIFYMLSAA